MSGWVTVLLDVKGIVNVGLSDNAHIQTSQWSYTCDIIWDSLDLMTGNHPYTVFLVCAGVP